MTDMSASRTAGYVILTSMAAGVELLRRGWSETRTDPDEEPDAAESR